MYIFRDTLKILNLKGYKLNGLKKCTDVESFEETDPAAVENYGFLTFSTDFSTKISAAK